MQLNDLIDSDLIFTDMRPNSKKQLLQSAASHAAAATGMDEHLIFETLLQREKLGSTGIGNGVAIPHAKIVGLPSIMAMFIKLAKPIDFESMDDAPADLIFVLLAPAGSGADHLKALSRIARVMREPNMLQRLRLAADRRAVIDLLTRERQPDAA